MFYKGKEYYSINKWIGIFNKNYKDIGIKVNSHILHHLFNHYNIPHINANEKGEICEDGKIIMYPRRLVENMMYQKESFINDLKGIINYWDEYNVKKEVDDRNKSYNNIKTIKISESAYNRLFENFKDEGFQINNGIFRFNPNHNRKADTSIFKNNSKELNVKTVLLPKSNIISYNLYDLNDLDVSKALKHKKDKNGNIINWYDDSVKNYNYSNSIQHFINRSCLYIKRIIGNSSVDYITYPQSSSKFNNLFTSKLLNMFPNSHGIQLIPEMLIKNVKGIYVNVDAAKQAGLTDLEIKELRNRVEKWKYDEDIRYIRRKIEQLKQELAKEIGKRGRPSKEVQMKKNMIKGYEMQIDLVPRKGRDSTIDDNGNVKDWQIKSLDEKVRKAIEGIFSINPKYLELQSKLKGKTIVLFDDNLSSGATMDDLCLALLQYGVKEIIPITLGIIPPTKYKYSDRR